MGGLGASWGVVLADSGSQARLGRRPGRLVGDFGGLDGPNLGPKMASSWGLDRTKIDANIETRFFEKTLFFLGKTMILRVQEVEVGSQDRSKIDQKTKLR